SQHCLPFLQFDVEKRRARQDARIVDEHIYAAVPPCDIGHDAAGLARVGDVERYRLGGTAAGDHRRRQSFGSRRIGAEADPPRGPGRGEPGRDRLADASGGTRHDGDAAGQPGHEEMCMSSSAVFHAVMSSHCEAGGADVMAPTCLASCSWATAELWLKAEGL